MSNLSKQLQALDISKLKMSSGNTVKRELQKHAAILADCIMDELDKVYDSHEPKIYQRTYGLYNSLQIGNVKLDVSAAGASLGITLTFDENAIHKGFDGEPVNTAVLLNEGWSWHNGLEIPYMSNRAGIHFIESGIEKYKQRVKNPFKVKLHINNEIRDF